ncbi:MAG: hypothetical protein H6P95_147 [Candidatus Aminicenantes bacterium]|nr:hypothetical protein [Candidatus Aminicenantes bacterium]
MIAFSTTVSALLLNLALAGVVPSPPASGDAKSAAPPPPPPASLSERALTATAEVVGINFGVWAFLHYAGNADYSYISWETIRDNIRDGWEWDRSRYYVNFYHHPYHGYLYYNCGRANGLGFWGSSLSALGGSFMWEMMMEKYRPSINDLVTTTCGGIVYGEVGYRFSALVRKRDARGVGRIWRELVGTILDPVGGVNRLFNGRKDSDPSLPGAPDAGRILNGWLELTGPVIARSDEFSGSEAAPTIAFTLDYGDAGGAGWTGKPFDVFSIDGRLRWGPDRPHLSLFINGALAGRAYAGRGDSSHFLGLYQHYEYYGLDTMRVCGTSFTAGWASRFELTPNARLTASARLGWLGLGASDDFYGLEGERRGYNLATGVTAAAALAVAAKGFEYLNLAWRHYDLFDLDVPGSRVGQEAWNIFMGQVAIPVLKDIGFGFAAEYCVRRYDFEGFAPGDRKLFEARAFVTWQF